ncbi:hypothetical protein HPP92_023589 [Vanilla planifolia]|uniref:RRM domain-containing protein n=1 Tax=Vanilla planifolia TaxID=51239 RepID=A0A835UDX0_VANPL|nr:hypothetical protein HPP92_023589 [Vanilla planifolia]
MEYSSDFSDATGFPRVRSLKTYPMFSGWHVQSAANAYHGSSDASLFSSSLPVLPHEKLKFAETDAVIQSLDDASSKSRVLNDDAVKKFLDDSDIHGVGSLLPDDEEALLAGIVDDFDLSELPGQIDDLEEFDIFGSGNISGHYGLSNGAGTIVGEHPYGEHPSRTLFVRNINSNVEDSELRSLFEQYGDIRTMYTACKNRGFVMISYYDIRAARTAMRALQNKPLRRRKLDIHFSIPKENPTDKDLNQGTLVIFNLDPSVSNDDLQQIFGAFGEVKEIRETPHKRHHKFIEFYDIRAAEAALRALNKSDIAGKRIKLEPSRPGGARRSLIQQMGLELEKDESRIYRNNGGSPIASSPPGTWGQFSESGSTSPFARCTGSNGVEGVSYLPGLAALVSPPPSSVKIISGKEKSMIGLPDHVNRNQLSQGVAYQHSHSFPEQTEILHNTIPNMVTGSSLVHATSSTSGIGTMTGTSSLWGSPPFTNLSHPSSWQSMTGQGLGQGAILSGHHIPFIGSPTSLNHQYHHVGSAPSGISIERPYGYFSENWGHLS